MSDVSSDTLHISLAAPRSLRRPLSLLGQIEAGTLHLDLPDGKRFTFRGPEAGPQAVISIRSLALARRFAAGDVGLADGYIAGEWDTPSLVDVLHLLAANQRLIERFSAQPLIRAVQMARHWLNRNTKAGSKRNIHAHYDLGNAFYAAWLDETMTYSSGLEVGDDLAASQRAKYAAMAAAAGIVPGDRVLEIGCGWGGFAEFAGRMGCRVTALTISPEQLKFAQQRIAAAGLSDTVEIVFRDYREETGVYDRIVSIEMLEAVGERYWPVFFDRVARNLRPGGRAALQVITIREDIFPRYRKEMDFIRHYIFPGGMLPTPEILVRSGRDVGLTLTHDRAFGRDYAETCRLWRERFTAAWPEIAPLGFDEKFRRLWSYYLAYCEAGFRAGTIDVHQVAFEKAGG